MVLIAMALLVAAVALTARWRLRPCDGVGRERTFPVVSVGVLGLLAVAAIVPSYLRHQEERRLSTAASQLAGVTAHVHCQTFGQTFTEVGGELGFVRFDSDGVPEHQTFIKRGPCGDLQHYLDSNKRTPSQDEIVAVHVLTHESMHMKGITGEAEAECAAVQRDATTAELLGATEAQGLALARAYWLTIYPRMSGSYRTANCAPGGSLDEHLPHPPWYQ